MQIKVHMLAFSETSDVVRMVTIPEATLPDDILEKVFYYGQNEFAIGLEKNTTYSVSVGDVVELDGRLFICKNEGWGRITEEEYKRFAALPHRERMFHPLTC